MSLRNDLFDDLEEVQRPSPNIELLDKLKLYLDRTEVKVALAILIIVLIVGYLAGNIFRTTSINQADSSVGSGVQSDVTKITTTTLNTKIRIYITGEIQKPGVYEIDNKLRLLDLITLAGQTTPNADLTSCNLAEFLADGMKIQIPTTGNSSPSTNCNGQSNAPSISGAPTPGSSGSSATGLININTASLTELETLPGIGPSYAKAIVDYRTKNNGFTKVNDLQKVKGIGDKKFEALKDLITI
jgi:competence protein ComEA